MDSSVSEKTVNQHIGNRIRTIRSARGLTQEGLAQAIKVSFQQVQKYERGINRVSPHKLTLIAIALQCTPDTFWRGLFDYGGEAPAVVRELRGFVAAWGLEHQQESARTEARDLLGISHATG